MDDLKLRIKVEDDGSLVVKNFGQAIKDSGSQADNAKNKFSGLQSALGTFHNKISGLFKSMLSLKGGLVSLAGAAGLGLTARSFLDAASATESYRTRLEILLGSTEKASRLFADMSDYASRVPFTYDKIMESATALSGVLKGGVGQINQWMPMIGDLAAASGLSIEQTTQQVIRMYSAGAGAADLFRERGILAMMKFEAGVSYSAEETAKKMMAAWEQPESKFRGAADKLGKTWKGLLSMLSDRWFQFRNKVMEAGLFDVLKTHVEALLKKIDELADSGKLTRWANTISRVVTVAFNGMGKAIKLVTDHFEALKTAAAAFIAFKLGTVIYGIGAAATTAAVGVGSFAAAVGALETAAAGLLAIFATPVFVAGLTALGLYGAYKASERYIQENQPYTITNPGVASGHQTPLPDWLLYGTPETIFNMPPEYKLPGELQPQSLSQMAAPLSGPVISPPHDTKENLEGLLHTEIKRRTEIRKQNEEIAKQNLKIIQQTDLIKKNSVMAAAMGHVWGRLSTTIDASFRNTFHDIVRYGKFSFKGLGDSILDIFADVATEIADKKFIQPFVDNLVNALSQGLSTLGTRDMSTLMGTSWGGLGITTGIAIGITGLFDNILSGSEPKLPSFDLLWETLDGQIANVNESWKNMAPDQKVVAAAEEFVQNQLDFFQKLSVMTSTKISDFTFELKGLGQNIKQILSQSTAQGVVKAAIGEAGQLSEVLGPGFQQQLQNIFMQSMSPNLGMFASGQDQQVFQDYMNWKFGQFMSMPSNEAMNSFESWMNTSSIFSPAGQPGIIDTSIFDIFQSLNPNLDYANPTPDMFSQLEQFASTQRPSLYTRGQIALGTGDSQSSWDNFFTDLNQQITDIFDLITNGMGEAFSASLQTGGFQTFEDKFKQSILSSVQQGLIKGFAEQELLPIIFKPFYGTSDRPAFTEVLKQYQAGDLSLSQTQGYLSQIMAEFNTTLSGFAPAWDLLNQTNQSLVNALGLNTTALGSNTDAVLGPVNAFLNKMDTSLAPSQSLAGIASGYNQRLADAIANPKSFSEFASYASQYMLPTAQSISSNYPDIWSGVRSDVTNMPWVANAMQTPTAQSIGYEVGQNLGPMLADLKESQQITINVVVDGQVIKQTVIDSLDDPAVAQKVRTRI